MPPRPLAVDGRERRAHLAHPVSTIELLGSTRATDGAEGGNSGGHR
jgi:hypothetical protein